jgi:hypothetical protein
MKKVNFLCRFELYTAEYKGTFQYKMENSNRRGREQGKFPVDKKVPENEVSSIPIAEVIAWETTVPKFCLKELMYDACSFGRRYFVEVS